MCSGKIVHLICDNDDPGRAAMGRAAQLLVRLDPPARAKILQLPGLTEGEDIVQFVEQRNSRDRAHIVAELRSLADGTPWFEATFVSFDGAPKEQMSEARPDP